MMKEKGWFWLIDLFAVVENDDLEVSRSEWESRVSVTGLTFLDNSEPLVFLHHALSIDVARVSFHKTLHASLELVQVRLPELRPLLASLLS